MRVEVDIRGGGQEGSGRRLGAAMTFVGVDDALDEGMADDVALVELDDADALDALFDHTTGPRQDRQLLFSTCFDLMTTVVCRVKPSIHAAHQAADHITHGWCRCCGSFVAVRIVTAADSPPNSSCCSFRLPYDSV